MKVKTYHEIVNSAIMDAIVRPLGGDRTPKSCMLTSVASYNVHTRKGSNKEIKRMEDERNVHTLFF